MFPDGDEESLFADGKIQRIDKTGIKTIEYPNGEKEVIFPDGTTIKEYADGKVKKIHPDGTYEYTNVS